MTTPMPSPLSASKFLRLTRRRRPAPPVPDEPAIARPAANLPLDHFETTAIEQRVEAHPTRMAARRQRRKAA